MTGKRNIEATKTVHITQWHGGGTGEYGITCYRLASEPKSAGASMYGLPLEKILDKDLWDGAVVEVTVRLVKQGKKTVSALWARNKRPRKRVKKK